MSHISIRLNTHHQKNLMMTTNQQREVRLPLFLYRSRKDVMRDLNTVFCHQHSHSQPRYPHFTLCPYCREEAPHETIVVEAAVNYFSHKLRDFFIETELEIQMGTTKRRADIVLVDGKQNYVAIVECKRIGVQEDGINQLKSYLCATATPLGVFANSTEPGDWEFYENLGRNQFKDITSNLFWKNIQGTLEEESTQPLADAETYYKSGLAKAKLEQYNAAIADFDTTIQLKPDYAAAYCYRGAAKADLGQNAAAIADFDTAIRLNPDESITYINRGVTKAKIGQNAAAIADFDTATRLNPDEATAYCYRGIAKHRLGQSTAAIADFDTAIRLNPDEATAYYLRGCVRISRLDCTGAITDFDTAVHLKPDFVEVYHHRGKAKADLGQHAAAIADYDMVIRLKPDYADAYNNRGLAKTNIGQNAAAIADFDTAIRLKPNYADAYNNRGEAKGARGQLFAAIHDFYKASRLLKKR